MSFLSRYLQIYDCYLCHRKLKRIEFFSGLLCWSCFCSKLVSNAFNISLKPFDDIAFSFQFCTQNKKISVHYQGQCDDLLTIIVPGKLIGNLYDVLITKIREYYAINGKLERLYENVNNNKVYIDDFDDLLDSLEDINDGESLHLYLSRRKPQKTVSLLLIGETGVGKTTLLKSLKDFVMGPKFKNIKYTEKPQSTGLSQTTQSKQYKLSNDEWDLNVTDTPGIGDTSGLLQDKQHINNIINAMCIKGGYNAICFLIKRGSTRLTTKLKYVINELRINMPKHLQNNFLVIMTRSNIPIPDQDTIDVIKGLQLPTNNIIPVNNCAYEEILNSIKYTSKISNSVFKMVQKDQFKAYYENHNYLRLLLETAHKMQPYECNQIKELKFKRDALHQDIMSFKSVTDNISKLNTQINEQLNIVKAQNKLNLYYNYEENEEYTEYEYIKENGKVTTHCNICSKSCHINCQCITAYSTDLYSCSCMSASRICRKCGCSTSNHCQIGWKAVPKLKNKTVINQHKKLKYDEAQFNKRICENKGNKLRLEIKELIRFKDIYVKVIQSKYAEIKNISIMGYNESYRQYLEECIKAVGKDNNLTIPQKQDAINILQVCLDHFKVFQQCISSDYNQVSMC